MSSDVTRIGITAGRQPHRVFGIKQADRLQHMHVIGKTGVGKSSLLQSMMKSDTRARRAFVLIDPHGDLATRMDSITHELAPDSHIYLDAANPQCRFGFNPLRRVAPHLVSLVASGLLETFKKRFFDAWGTRMEHIFRHAILALLEHGDATLDDVLRILTDKKYATRIVGKLTNAPVRDFWLHEFPNYSIGYRRDSIAPIQTKLGGILTNPSLRRILITPQEQLSFRRVMDERKTLIVNLAKGVIGADGSGMLGALIVSTLTHAALSRADTEEQARSPIILYIDEFQTMLTQSIAEMLSELRKYGVGLVLAHQYLEQIDSGIRAAVLGNVGSSIVFRLGMHDAEYFSRELMPELQSLDFMSLENRGMYVRLMIDGEPSKPFSARTIDMH